MANGNLVVTPTPEPQIITLGVAKLRKDAIVPTYAHEGDAGFDLYSVDELILYPNQYQLVGTGIALDIPFGYEVQVRPRSGLALKHGITILNSPGTVDCSYRGEIMVMLINHSAEWFRITKGMRIAQGVLAKCTYASFVEVEPDKLTSTTRGSDGFGSTGTH